MARGVVMALGLAAAGVAGLQACTTGSGHEDVALVALRTALCDKAFECRCDGLDRLQDGLCELDLSGGSRGAFDAACLEQWLEWAQGLDCFGPPSIGDIAALCPLYHGTEPAGAECRPDDTDYSECSRGLRCVAGRCADLSGLILGEVGGPCDQLGLCNGETRCIDDRCERLPDHGQPCLEGACSSGNLCVFDVSREQQLCVAGVAVGRPCNGHAVCASGNCPSGFCAPPAEQGDPCSGNLPCGPGFVCADNVCTAGGDGSFVTSTCELLQTF